MGSAWDRFGGRVALPAIPYLRDWLLSGLFGLFSPRCALTLLIGSTLAQRPRGGALSYPAARAFPGVREAIQIDALGRRCGLPPWERYLSVLGQLIFGQFEFVEESLPRRMAA